MCTCTHTQHTGETIKIVIEDYVQHLANYNLRLIYKPELLFDQSFQYDNRIHLEFNHLYHWHPFNPDVFNIDGKRYTIEDFRFNAAPVLEHGMRNFVDAMSKSLAGKVRNTYTHNAIFTYTLTHTNTHLLTHIHVHTHTHTHTHANTHTHTHTHTHVPIEKYICNTYNHSLSLSLDGSSQPWQVHS